MKINPREWDKYETPTIQYVIEFSSKLDLDNTLKQLERVHNSARYQCRKNKELGFLIVLSQNNGDMSKQVSIKTGKRGRPKKVFVRDDNNPLYHSSIPHETRPHLHLLAVGKGSAMATQKICESEKKHNCKAHKKRIDADSIGTEVGYLLDQASIIRTVGKQIEFEDSYI